jgi:outer membrane protein assembly factor BamB
MSRVVDFLPKFYRKVLFGIVGITSLVIILIVGQTLINHSQSWHYKFSSQIGEFEIATLRENNINVLKKSPNCILVTNRSSSVSCLDPITGKITWQNWLPEAASTTSFYSLKYQMFAIITANGGLVGIDEKSGQTKWNFVNPQNTHWERVQMDEAQEKIMALDRHNSFFVLDFSSGKIAWSVIEAQINEKNLNYIPKGSLYQSNNLIILTNLKTGTIKAFAKNSGDNLWQRNDAKKDISGFISLDNGAVWYESDYGTLNKVNSKTGVQTISIAIPINDDISSIPGLIQIYNNNERIIKWYGSSSGELLRQVTLPGKIKRIWSEQGLFAIMYFGPYQEKLAKINPKTGEIIWLSENLGVIRDTSQSTDSITIISLYGMVVWLDPKTGQTQAKLMFKESQDLFLMIQVNPPNFG